MFIVNENDKEYRFGDSGPKYLMAGPRMSLGIVCLKPGEDFAAHHHGVMEENFFVVEGTIEFLIDNVPHVLTAGNFIHVEPGEVHYLRNTSDKIAKAHFALAPYMEKDKVLD